MVTVLKLIFTRIINFYHGHFSGLEKHQIIEVIATFFDQKHTDLREEFVALLPKPVRSQYGVRGEIMNACNKQSDKFNCWVSVFTLF